MTRYYLKSIKKDVSTNYTLAELKSCEKRIQEQCNIFIKISYNFDIKDIIENAKHDLKLIQKLQRKVNGYKNIIITKEGDYDSFTTIIDFPKGTRKDFKYQWLIHNNYPTESEHYRSDSMYDCTGKICDIYVEHDKNKVIITSYRDL